MKINAKVEVGRTTFQDEYSKCKYRLCCSGYIPQMCFNHTYDSQDDWCELNASSRTESCMVTDKKGIYPLKGSKK